MTDERFFMQAGRKIIITGHYGSGKTEFAVSLTMLLASGKIRIQNPARKEFAESGERAENKESADHPVTYQKLALIDLDVVNPYFRSRERREMLDDVGVRVFGSVFDTEVTAELPALSADVRAPLEDETCRVIVDAGGNDSGALVLNQFGKYFTGDDATVLAVVNANRPETADPAGALGHIRAIEAATGLTVTGIVNNCHLLRETTAATVIKGHNLCREVCDISGKRLVCDCYPAGIVDPNDLQNLSGSLMPLGLYMRPTWLDK